MIGLSLNYSQMATRQSLNNQMNDKILRQNQLSFENTAGIFHPGGRLPHYSGSSYLKRTSLYCLISQLYVDSNMQFSILSSLTVTILRESIRDSGRLRSLARVSQDRSNLMGSETFSLSIRPRTYMRIQSPLRSRSSSEAFWLRSMLNIQFKSEFSVETRLLPVPIVELRVLSFSQEALITATGDSSRLAEIPLQVIQLVSSFSTFSCISCLQEYNLINKANQHSQRCFYFQVSLSQRDSTNCSGSPLLYRKRLHLPVIII